MRQGLLLLAAISGFLAVALGAFGAHELVAIFKLGVDYHFYHTFAIIAVALSGHWISSKLLDWAGYLFFVGILLFSGSLYLY
ncbi:DUF423 domain-containing protein, partial [Pseudomonadota bacterium]